MISSLEHYAQHLSVTLLHQLWIGGLAGAFVYVGTRCLPDATAHQRYRLTAAALGAMLLSLPVTWFAIDAGKATIATSVQTPLKRAVPSSVVPTDHSNPSNADSPNLPSRGTVAASENRQFALSHGAERLSIVSLVAAIYAMGVAVMLVRLVGGLRAGHQLRQASCPVGDLWLLDLVGREAHRVGLRAAPLVRFCEQVTVPAVIGVMRPALLLPVSIVSGLSREQLRFVVLHELVHVRCLDHIAVVIQHLSEALLFFHPAAWYLSRRLNVERENRCDDLVVQVSDDRLKYADSLCRVAELSTTPTTTASIAVAADGRSASLLRRRIVRLLTTDKTPQRPSRRGGFAAGTSLGALAIAVLVMITASMRTAPSQDKRADGQSERNATGNVVESQQLPATSPEVKRAIAWVMQRQQANGAWQSGVKKPVGETALALIALQRSREVTQQQQGRRAYLRGCGFLADGKPDMTYTVALRIRALCARDPKKYEDQLKADLQYLIRGQQPNGGWRYTDVVGQGSDGSNTGYAVRALSAAADSGLVVPEGVWKRVAAHWVDSQKRDGGWSYVPGGGNPTASMTLTGIVCLEIAKKHVRDVSLSQQCGRAIQRAHRWCLENRDSLFRAKTFPYYQFDVLTCAFQSDDHGYTEDLLKRVVATIRKAQQEDGSWQGNFPEVATMLAIQALRRAEESLRRRSR